MYSVTSLVKLGDSSAYDKLEDSLRSDNTGVRIQAIKLLKELKDNRAIDILKYKAEFDPSTKVQSEAISALKELGVDYKKVLDEKTGKDTKDKAENTKDNSKENPSDEK
jgi:HEAT repeat protein